MDRRLELHAVLVSILGSGHVYFQEPANVQMKYPAIVYGIDDQDTKYANNNPYFRVKRYEVKVIDRIPDSPIPDAVAALPLCSFNRRYAADNLIHDVFNLYF